MRRDERGDVDGGEVSIFFAKKTSRIYNRLAFVNTIAQVFHNRGIAARYKPSPFTSQTQPHAAAQTTHIKPPLGSRGAAGVRIVFLGTSEFAAAVLADLAAAG